MRPSVVILGFVLGSSAAISFALVGVVFAFSILRGEHPRLDEELPALLGSTVTFLVLTALAGLSFYGQLRGRPWRSYAAAALVLGLLLTVGFYWQLWG